MTKSKPRHPERDFTPAHPNAAAIDIAPGCMPRQFRRTGTLSQCARSGPAPAICAGWRIGSSVAAFERSRWSPPVSIR
jgi:hypothetical protein